MHARMSQAVLHSSVFDSLTLFRLGIHGPLQQQYFPHMLLSAMHACNVQPHGRGDLIWSAARTRLARRIARFAHPQGLSLARDSFLLGTLAICQAVRLVDW